MADNIPCNSNKYISGKVFSFTKRVLNSCWTGVVIQQN